MQDVVAQFRTLKLALEARLGIAIDDNLPVVQWLLEHAVFVLNKFGVGHDGMTSYERLTGRKWRRPVVEIGEIVLAKMAIRRDHRGKAKKHRKKLKRRSVDAVWVGQIARTGEHVVVRSGGNAVRCRTVRRVPVEHRWIAERALSITATPRLPSPNSTKPEDIEPRLVDEDDVERPPAHLERQEDAKSDHPMPAPPSGADLEMPEGHSREGEKREFRITDRLLDKYGYFEDLPRLRPQSAWIAGANRRSPLALDRVPGATPEGHDDGRA